MITRGHRAGAARFPSAAATRRGWRPTSRSGAEIVRSLAQADALPDVVRVSDQAETRVSMAPLGGGRGQAQPCSRATCGCAGGPSGCLIVCGWEGEPRGGRAAPGAVGEGAALGRRRGPGRRAGRAWERGRYEGPYLRDELLDLGYMVGDARDRPHLEPPRGTSTRQVRAAIGAALAAQGTPGIVICHLSHAYRDGASLYFTFLARRRPGAELEQWRVVKTAACEAIVGAGGTITHHHAVGRDHAPYMRGRGRRAGGRGPSSGQGAPRPAGDHEPRQADSGEVDPTDVAGRA